MNNAAQREQNVESFSGDSVPSINNSYELQSLLFNAGAMNQLQQLATVMCKSVVTVPKHLQGNPGDCMAICMQAAQWGMNPFAVAQKTHVVNGTLGYEAQLVNAVLQSTKAIDGHFSYEYRGEGPNMECRVAAKVRGDSDITWGEWLRFSDVTTKNSPVWKTNPKQQIGYLQVKNWARQYCPGALLGVYTVDEMEAYAGSEREMGAVQRHEQPKEAARPALDLYPEDSFSKNFDKWQAIVESGKKSAGDIVAMLESKAMLSDEQREQILALEEGVEV